jgi:Tol biopolymer transport system component
MSSGDGRGDRKRGPDTLDAIGSARTLPSDPHVADRAEAETGATDPAGGPSIAVAEELLGDRYRVLAELGRGGEGIVYRARDVKADTVVALKLLPSTGDSDMRLLRFRRELQMARRVTHPNVVRIHDLVELPGRFGLSMELVEGEPLDDRLARGKMSRDEVVALAIDLARALAAAHAAGVIHRDLKPGNVLIRKRDGRAMVTDFGVSRVLEGEDASKSDDTDSMPIKFTREGAIIGTPQYMAPEQLEGRTDIGPPADVYAFGLVVWEAATGAPLHDASTIGELKRLRRESTPTSLRSARPDVPRALCDAVSRSLSVEPRDRFENGSALLQALESIESRARPARARTLLIAVAVAVGVVGVVGALVATTVVIGRLSTAAALPPAADGSSGDRPFTMSLANARRLTSGECEEFPSFTPDGQSVLYDGTIGRSSYIFMVPFAGGTPQQLTRGVHGWDMAARMAPQGDRIVFTRFEGTRYGSYVAPVDGTQAPRLLGTGRLHASWTPDGKGIWSEEGRALIRYDAATATPLETIPLVSGRELVEVVETARGTLVGLFTASGTIAIGAVGIIGRDGNVRFLVEDADGASLAVTPDGRHALTARHGLTGESELVDVPLDGSPLRSLAASGVVPQSGIALSPRGDRIAWSNCRSSLHASVVGKGGQLGPLFKTEDTDAALMAWIPGGGDFAVVSTRAGKPDLSVVDPTGDRPGRALPFPDSPPKDLAVSHDGARYAIATDRGILVGPIVGTEPLRLVTSEATDSQPSFGSGDAKLLFTRRAADGLPRVMVGSLEGGAVTALLEPGSDGANPSPVDGRIAYFSGDSPTAVVPTIWDSRTDSRRPVSPELARGKYRGMAFSLDGRRIAVIRGPDEVAEVDVATGGILRSISMEGQEVHQVLYTPAGLVLHQTGWRGDVWVADLE